MQALKNEILRVEAGNKNIPIRRQFNSILQGGQHHDYELLQTLHHNHEVETATFIGKNVLTSALKGKVIQTWDISKQQAKVLTFNDKLTQHYDVEDDDIWIVSFSKDGSLAAVTKKFF